MPFCHKIKSSLQYNLTVKVPKKQVTKFNSKFQESVLSKLYHFEISKTLEQMIVDPHEATHSEPPLLNLRCLQIIIFIQLYGGVFPFSE